MNRIIVNGRFTADAEMEEIKSGLTLIKFQVACNTAKKDGDNYKVEYFHCSYFGNKKDYLLKYGKKGSRISLFGELNGSAYKSKTDEPKYSLYVNVNDFELMGGGETTSATKETTRPKLEETDVELPF